MDTSFVILRIHGANTSVLEVSLKEILDCCCFRDQLHWSIQAIEAYDSIGQDAAAQWEKRVYSAENALIVNEEQLAAISEDVHQIINLNIIADFKVKHLKAYDSQMEMMAKCFYVIRLIDSSFWEVFCQKEELLETFADVLERTEYITINA